MPLSEFDPAAAKRAAETFLKLTMSVWACPDHPDAEMMEEGSCPMSGCGKAVVKVDRAVLKRAKVDDKAKAIGLKVAPDRALTLADVRSVAERSSVKIDEATMAIKGRVLVAFEGVDRPGEVAAILKTLKGVKCAGVAGRGEDGKTARLLVEGDQASLAEVRRALDAAGAKFVELEWGQRAADAKIRDE